MKRHRPWVSDEPRHALRRFRAQRIFFFSKLLPEMRAEIVARVHGFDDRVSLALTCKQLLRDIHPPRLPPPWRRAWTTIRTEFPESAEALRYAFLEMIRVGVPTWPGAFRYAAIDIVYYPERGPSVLWWWKDLSERSENDVVEWFPRERQLCIGHQCWVWPPEAEYGYEPHRMVKASSLDEILEARGDALRALVTQSRPVELRAFHPRREEEEPHKFLHDFDEDTPAENQAGQS
jgi:hypothetical protein